jgi:dephospho-CoA kinase
VAKLYQQNRNIFNKLKGKLPKYINSFPIEKKEISNAILGNKNNLNKIVKIVHYEIRKKLKNFLKKNKDKKIVILDIPLLLENKLNKKEDVLVYVQSKKSSISKNLKKRKNFNQKLLNKFKAIQLPISYKKKISNFIIKNDFTKRSINDRIKNILKEIE